MQRWATNCLILHNPHKMMRVAYQVRAAVDPNGICKTRVDPLTQRRVLVSRCCKGRKDIHAAVRHQEDECEGHAAALIGL